MAKSIALHAVLKGLEQQNLNRIDRTLAITALGQLKDPRSIDPLIQQLIHPDPSLRLHILHALQHIDPLTAFDRLQSQFSQFLSAQSPLTDALQDGIHFALTEWRS